MSITTFSAFKSHNYKLFFAGQFTSLLGTWMQKTAVSWVIYAQTQSKVMLGVSVFATLFPSALLTPFGGVVSDRYNRYRVLLFTQFLSMIQAILLTLVVFFNNYAVWEIISLSVILGLINAYDVPARQSLVYEMVEDKKDLPNALALNSSMVNLSKLIGPAIAGLAIESLGEVVCFGLNAISFIAVIGSLLLMKLPAYVTKPHTKNVWGDLKDGLVYIRQTSSIRYIIMMLALICFFVLPFTSLMPIYAKDIFHGTASTFGLLDSAIGLGAFIGAIFLASLQPGTSLSRILTINTFVFGVGLLLFSYTGQYPLALFFVMIAAFGMMAQTTISNTLLQTMVIPEMRGRVISIFVMVYSGFLPLGTLLVGTLSEHISVQAVVFLEGILALCIGAMHLHYLRKEKMKQRLSSQTEHLSQEILPPA